MPKAKTETNIGETPIMIPPSSPDEEEKQIASLALQRIKERLLNNTATAQEIIYCAKLGSSQMQAENEKLRREVELLTAKTDMLQSQKTSEELYTKALDAMRLYRGESGDEDIP